MTPELPAESREAEALARRWHDALSEARQEDFETWTPRPFDTLTEGYQQRLIRAAERMLAAGQETRSDALRVPGDGRER